MGRGQDCEKFHQTTFIPECIPSAAKPLANDHLHAIFCYAPQHGKAWTARLYVCARRMGDLMRNGFEWDESHVCGHLMSAKHGIQHLRTGAGGYKRKYTLKSYDEEDPKYSDWRAELFVSLRNGEAMTDFTLKKLDPERIVEAAAYIACNVPKHGHFIYYFNRKSRNANFNCFHGNMPLKGIWPWPKGPETPVEKLKLKPKKDVGKDNDLVSVNSGTTLVDEKARKKTKSIEYAK